MSVPPLKKRRSSQAIPARSHFVTRPDFNESPARSSLSASEVRQQTMSWTYRELSNPLYGSPLSAKAITDLSEETHSEEGEQELGFIPSEIVEVHDFSEEIPLLEDSIPLTKHFYERIWRESLYSMPAVLLATMLTLLDAISYGIIIFPASDLHIPASAPHAGISIFLASTIISQIVYTAGGSAFKGAVGSMMIEVMPFLHIICSIIESKMINSPDNEILATIMAAYALSTLITGVVFLLLGIFKLGNVIQFFPRHILVGCIGGIGLFLILTGIEITAKIEPIITLQYFIDILEWKALKIWGLSLCIAIALKLIQEFVEHPLVVPIFYATVPLLFYAIVFVFGLNLDVLRNQGWLFKFDTKDVPFYVFWTYYDFFNINWNAILATIPTQLALTFFGILHVPINVPALSVSTKQDVDLSKEIIGHGISNIAAGLFGVTQNYMVYSNSLLYIRSGGNSTTAGVILILTTVLLWIKGSFLISYVPSIVVGSLIFHLGIDLIKESVFDTWSVGMHPLEYFTIITIVIVMGAIGFTEGVVVGTMMACIFFVVMYSQKSIIRETFTGTQLRSSVHRLYRQQSFLDKVGTQTHIIKLQGYYKLISFMFFGTVNQLDKYMVNVITIEPKTRFVVLDFSLISGVDYSGLESFLRIKRHLVQNKTHLVLCGLGNLENEVLNFNKVRAVGLLDDDDDAYSQLLVHVFDHLNDALEWSENFLLGAYYKKSSRSLPETVSETQTHVESATSPRASQLNLAASSVLEDFPIESTCTKGRLYEPFRFMIQSLSDQRIIDDDMVTILGPEFEKKRYKKGNVIYKMGDFSDALYIVDDGQVGLTVSDDEVVETLLPGIMVGELELLSGRNRVCNLMCISDATVWRFSKESLEKLSAKHPDIILKFVTKIAIPFDTVRLYNTMHHWAQLR